MKEEDRENDDKPKDFPVDPKVVETTQPLEKTDSSSLQGNEATTTVDSSPLKEETACPCKRGEGLTKIGRIEKNILMSLPFRCPRCPKVLKYEHLESHFKESHV
eukprot:CAMPEP_0170493934 /NCGR_PEP_ID=MMETSP0208-20121228/14352_1 /TAXON_ID=197538 /ORGANISM="Strombidium inclinatum, Strain S3" /LENGTH=103 /DNA_ID=CAMNT_0010769919 /DNA_START=384 /DNA_END=695 /DNA_ORIENTATION=+